MERPSETYRVILKINKFETLVHLVGFTMEIQNHLFFTPNLKYHPKNISVCQGKEWHTLQIFAQFYFIFSRFGKTAHLSVRMEQVGSHWADFHEN